MRLGGWLRLWVVMTLLWGALVAFLAFNSRPRVENVKVAWTNEGMDLIRTRVNETEGSNIQSWQIANYGGFATPEKAIEYFERVEHAPTKSQKIFNVRLAAINETYRQRLREIDAGWPKYVAQSVAVWLIPAILVFALGLMIRWILRGFAHPKTGRDL